MPALHFRYLTALTILRGSMGQDRYGSLARCGEREVHVRATEFLAGCVMYWYVGQHSSGRRLQHRAVTLNRAVLCTAVLIEVAESTHTRPSRRCVRIQY